MNNGVWQSEIPQVDGYWWFYGFLDGHDPDLMGVALHKGEFYAFGESKPLPLEWFEGMWTRMLLPRFPVLPDKDGARVGS